MKRQRSKEELLNSLRTYKALQKDNERDQKDRVASGASYWRTGVEWTFILWKVEHFSTNNLVTIYRYVNENINKMDEQKRQQIRDKMDCSWILKNHVTKKKCKNAIDQTWNDLEHYNTEVATDYSLLVCDWLITNKHYGKVRLDRVLANVYTLDIASTTKVIELRQEIYDKKGIWISLNDEDNDIEEEVNITKI